MRRGEYMRRGLVGALKARQHTVYHARKIIVGGERHVMPPRGTANELQTTDTAPVFVMLMRRIPSTIPTVDSVSDRVTGGRSPLYPLFYRPHGKYFYVIRYWALRAAIVRNSRSAALASAGR